MMTPTLVRTLHHRPDTASVYTGRNQVPSGDNDFEWHINDPLLLANADETETRVHVKSDSESLMTDENINAENSIGAVDESNVASHVPPTQTPFDANNEDLDSNEVCVTKIKQEPDADRWNDRTSYDGMYTFGDTFRDSNTALATPQDGTSAQGSSHDLKHADPTQYANITPRTNYQYHVGDVSSMSVDIDTEATVPKHHWTWCRLCKRGTSNLERHMTVCQMNPDFADQAKFGCSKCSRLFKARSYLVDHERSFHSNAPSYECHRCRRFFKYRMQLKRHKEHCVGMANGPLLPRPTQLAATGVVATLCANSHDVIAVTGVAPSLYAGSHDVNHLDSVHERASHESPPLCT